MIDWIITPQTKQYQDYSKRLKALSFQMKKEDKSPISQAKLFIEAIMQLAITMRKYQSGGISCDSNNNEWIAPNWMTNKNPLPNFKHTPPCPPFPDSLK